MIWDPDFHKKFLGYASVTPFWERIAPQFATQWPQIADYNALAERILQDTGLRFVEQTQEMRYEQEVYLHKRIPTRLAHWHDFFNNLTWLNFPLSKWAILQRTDTENQQDKTNLKIRTPLQNVLAHFDECGIIFCSDDIQWFEHLKNFRWKALFWEAREALLTHSYSIVFGHGLMEKALSPYVGMTGKAVCIQVPSIFFTYTEAQKIAYVDQVLAQYIASLDFPTTPKALHPFPLLGWPAWDPHNNQELYYENTYYFRVK